MFRKRASFVGVALALAGTPAAAQQSNSDVGGQPARRKITKAPVLVKFVEASYPPRHLDESAIVVLTIELDAAGEVLDVAVASSGGPEFDEAAVLAAGKFVFRPAEVDERPAPSRITYRYAFVQRPAVGTSPPPSLKIDVEPPPPAGTDEVEIRARPRAGREATQVTVSADEARRVPGTQGDVLKVVQNLPGVSRPPVNSGQIVAWGSAPRETRTYVDGVEIPALYHGSGLRGVIPSDLVSSIDLVPGAYGVEYGRGLGGLVRVETRDLPRGTHGSIGADTLDGSVLVSTDLGPHARVGLALRQSWLDRVLAATSGRDIGDFFPIPQYRDGQLKATLDIDRRSRVDFVLLGATDDLTRTVPSPDPASTRSETTHTGFWRAYAHYTRSDEGGNATILTPFVGQDSSELTQRFGATPAHLAIDSDRYGLRAELRSRVARLPFTIGLDTLGTSSRIVREGSLTLPAREGDISVFGQPPGRDVATDRWTTNIVDVGPHLHADVRLGPLTVTPGARFDLFLVEGNRRYPHSAETPDLGYSRLETAFSPRIAAKVDLGPRLSLHAAYGTYSQAPEPEDLSAIFGTPDLALSKSTQLTAGERLAITESTSFDVVAFQKSFSDLVVRSLATNPLLARSLTQNGEGRAYGVTFLIRQELWRGFFGWVSYAISRSERRFEGQLDYRRFDFDQPHVLSIVASQEIGSYTLGVRFRASSGDPRTPVVGSVYDARSDRYDPIFGAQNTTRIPAFWQLDGRVERTFALTERLRLHLHADVQNVTNRENAEELIYASDFRQRGIIRGLPILAVVGARLTF